MARLVTAVWLCAVVGLTAAGCEHEPDVVALFHEEAPMAGASGAAAGTGTEPPSMAGSSAAAGSGDMQMPPMAADPCPLSPDYVDTFMIVNTYDCRFKRDLFPMFPEMLDRIKRELPPLMGESSVLGACDFASKPFYEEGEDYVLCQTTCVGLQWWLLVEQGKQVACYRRSMQSG